MKILTRYISGNVIMVSFFALLALLSLFAFIDVLGEVATVACQTPGCLEYIISLVPGEPHGVFVTEFWRSIDDQRGALHRPEIVALIERCSPLIDRVEQRALEPVA